MPPVRPVGSSLNSQPSTGYAGDEVEAHCYAAKGNRTPAYPLRNLFFLNLRFANGVIGQLKGLYDVLEPPLPMMQITLYGTRGPAATEFTDNKPGRLQIVSDQSPTKEPVTTHFEPERDTSVYGHGATAIRYMRHLQDCLDEDREPSPNVLDGARACAVAAAAWGSADTRKPVAVFNEF